MGAPLTGRMVPTTPVIGEQRPLDRDLVDLPHGNRSWAGSADLPSTES